MRNHTFWVSSSRQRLEQLAADLAEGCLPWLLTQVKARIRTMGQASRRGYVKAWAGLALQRRASGERLLGLSEGQRALVVARAVEKAAAELLRKLPPRRRHTLRKAA